MQVAMHISAWADGGEVPPVPPVVPSVTKFEVKTTSTNYKAGIYSAAAIDPTVATVVDWGDGNTDEVYGDISQLVHTYARSTATYTVEVSDNISTFALSTNNSTWYGTTTKNNKIITKLITLSSRVTHLPAWAFYHCEYMGSVYAGDSGTLIFDTTAPTYVYGNQFIATAYYNNGKFDFSGRTVQTIPAAAFADTGMTEFAWPKGVTTVGGSSAAANGAFYWAGYMTSITIPATITSIGDYAFARCETWKTITMEGATAPTVASTAFGNSTSGDGTYVGRSTYSTGTNRLIVPEGSTGYDTGVWLDPLCNATKCGFTKVVDYWGMYFEAEASGVTINMSKVGTPPGVTLETSQDGMTWTAFDAEDGTTPITLVNVGDRVYFRAGTGGNSRFATNSDNYRKFTISGNAGAHGSIMSLLDGDNKANVVIPETYCFFKLFEGCRSLTSGPQLPATTLKGDCYHGMFWECSGMKTMSDLPAKTLADGCYDTICYSCQNLTSVSIGAEDISANLCLSWSFSACRKLSSVTVAFTQWGSSSTGYWLGEVASSGTFKCPAALGTDSTITRGADNCPSGWTVVNI